MFGILDKPDAASASSMYGTEKEMVRQHVNAGFKARVRLYGHSGSA